MEAATSLVGAAVRGQRPLLLDLMLELWQTSCVHSSGMAEEGGRRRHEGKGRRKKKKGLGNERKGMKKEVKYYII